MALWAEWSGGGQKRALRLGESEWSPEDDECGWSTGTP